MCKTSSNSKKYIVSKEGKETLISIKKQSKFPNLGRNKYALQLPEYQIT